MPIQQPCSPPLMKNWVPNTRREFVICARVAGLGGLQTLTRKSLALHSNPFAPLPLPLIARAPASPAGGFRMRSTADRNEVGMPRKNRVVGRVSGQSSVKTDRAHVPSEPGRDHCRRRARCVARRCPSGIVPHRIESLGPKSDGQLVAEADVIRVLIAGITHGTVGDHHPGIACAQIQRIRK